MPYLGREKPREIATQVTLDTFTGNGTQTVYTLSRNILNDENLFVTINGVMQHTDSYSVTTTQITFSEAPANGDLIEIRNVTEVSVSGPPPANTVGTTELKNNSVGSDEMIDGSVGMAEIKTTELSPLVQIQTTSDGEYNSGTTIIPVDDTIPQSTEGDEYMTVSITPKAIGNKLIVEALVHLDHSASTNAFAIAALFRDSETSAVATGYNGRDPTANRPTSVPVYYEMTTTSLTTITFKIRGGFSTAGTTYFNGQGSRWFGGTTCSFVKVTEVLQ